MLRRFSVHLTRRLVLTVLLTALIGVSGVAVVASRKPAAVQYRTQRAAVGTVTQTLSLSGNLAPTNATNLDFGSSGHVTSVAVTPGAVVTAGETLATIDPTTLQATLQQAENTLTSAQAKLSLDEAGPTAQNLQQAQASVAGDQVALDNARTAYTDTVSVNAQAVTADQNAIPPAQNLVSADAGKVTADQSAVTTDCAGSPPAPARPQCVADQQQLAADTQTQAKDQQALNADNAALAAAQVKGQQSDDQAGATVATAQTQLSNAQAAVGALESGTTSQQITMDQAQVSTDQINVQTAQTAYNNATLTAPVAGTVVAVNVAGGDSVGGNAGSSASASSTTHAIVIETPGAFSVTGSISDAQVSEIAIAQKAYVTPAGATAALDGTVTAVAETATVTSGVATFPVTVTITGTHASLRGGMSATVTVVINQVVGVTTVPTSAVHTTAAGSTVNLLVNGVSQPTQVTVGASDATLTQIVQGVNVGDEVIIATVTSSVPSSGNGNALFTGGGGGTRTFRGGGGGPGGG